MSSPPSQSPPSPASTGPQRDEIIAALQRRRGELTTDEIQEIQHEQEHDIRQAFRRMIDPGIMRGTHKDTAFASMKALSYWIIILFMNEPDNVKYQRFKPTNITIKTNLIDVKIKLAFQDDRKRRALQDKLEKERRDARLTNPAATVPTYPNPSISEPTMPTSPGRSLSDPPPYDSAHEAD
ncbi:hypothetical protein Clacol_001656 [Clathrus columnatus]|uniref:PUB domain-containing protein n=1 Tax=Clathrus columnatus TaxID=1419009 RepID=A0AAV4ZYQ3_9AGAM|nr:hypothetical protein Clacol_001656 [Clathrus columnatus]